MEEEHEESDNMRVELSLGIQRCRDEVDQYHPSPSDDMFCGNHTTLIYRPNVDKMMYSKIHKNESFFFLSTTILVELSKNTRKKS